MREAFLLREEKLDLDHERREISLFFWIRATDERSTDHWTSVIFFETKVKFALLDSKLKLNLTLGTEISI